MTSVGEIYDFIDELAPFDTAMSFDNCGVLIGGRQQTVNRAIVTLDITPEVINEAQEKGAELIISHHPVIFSGLKSIKLNSVPALLVKSGICALAAHTNLDIAEKGVNFQLASALELNEIRFADIPESCISTGTLTKEMCTREFAMFVKEKLNCKGLRFTEIDKKIKTVAVACGAGGDSVRLLKAVNADALVTGEIKHSYIIEANSMNIPIFDAGHFKTENVIIPVLTRMLNDRFPDTEFSESVTFTDKIEYL